MKLRPFTWLAAWIAWLGMMLPASPVYAKTREAVVPSETVRTATVAADIVLGGSGTLFGLVVDAGGVPLKKVKVAVSQDDKVVASASTDAQGRFAARGLRPGTYQIAAGQGLATLNIYRAGEAPPEAREAVLIVGNQQVVRGRWKYCKIFCSESFIITAIVVVAVAIVVAISNSRNPA